MPGSAVRSAFDTVFRSSSGATAGLLLVVLVAVAGVLGAAFDLVCANAGSVNATSTMRINERTRFMGTSNPLILGQRFMEVERSALRSSPAEVRYNPRVTSSQPKC